MHACTHTEAVCEQGLRRGHMHSTRCVLNSDIDLKILFVFLLNTRHFWRVLFLLCVQSCFFSGESTLENCIFISTSELSTQGNMWRENRGYSEALGQLGQARTSPPPGWRWSQWWPLPLFRAVWPLHYIIGTQSYSKVRTRTALGSYSSLIPRSVGPP